MGRKEVALNVSEKLISELSVPLSRDEQLCVEVLNRQMRITSAPYYSTIHMEARKVGTPPGPYTYTLTKGSEYRAFSYAIRTPGSSAGFLPGYGNMTYAETNLQTKSETNAGQSVVIYGIAAMVEPGGIYNVITDEGKAYGKRFGDARLAAQVATNCSLALSVNGDENILRMGKLGAVPGHGGLQGHGQDSLAIQAIEGGRLPFGFMSNGWPVNTNFMKVPEGYVWKNTGTDSLLEIVVEVERDIILFSGGNQFVPAPTGEDETPAVGIRGYTYPDVVLLDITFYLLGWVMAKRTGLM